MSAQQEALDFVREEMNPGLEAVIREMIDQRIEKEEFVATQFHSIEAQKEKRKAELLKEFNLEERQKAFMRGVTTFQTLYPTVLNVEEQKQFMEELELQQKKVLSNEPFDITPYMLACMWRVANVSFKNKHLEEALAIYETTITLNGRLEGVWTSYAQCLVASNRIDEAAKAFKTAVALDKEAPLPLIGLVECAISQNHKQEALDSLKIVTDLLNRSKQMGEYRDTIDLLNSKIRGV